MVTNGHVSRDVAQALFLAGKNGIPLEQAIESIVIDAAQVQHEDTMTDLYQREADRWKAYGWTEAMLKDLERTNPEMVSALIAGRVPGETDPVEQEVPTELRAIGTGYGQKWIAPSDRAYWSAAFPPLDPDGYQRDAQPVARQNYLFKIAEGWRRSPAGPFRPPPHLKCRLLGPTASPCLFIGAYTESGRIRHERARHPDQFLSRAESEARELQISQVEAQRVMNEQTAALLSEIRGGHSGTLDNETAGTITVILAGLMDQMKALGVKPAPRARVKPQAKPKAPAVPTLSPETQALMQEE